MKRLPLYLIGVLFLISALVSTIQKVQSQSNQSIFTTGPITTTSQVSAGTDVNAGEDVIAGDDVIAADDITAGGDIAATGTVTGSNVSMTHTLVDSISSDTAGVFVIDDSTKVVDQLDVPIIFSSPGVVDIPDSVTISGTISNETDGPVVVDDSLEVTGSLDVTEMIRASNPHFCMGFTDSSATIACTQDSLEQLTNVGGDLFAVDDSLLWTYIPGDTLQCDVTGHYLALFTLSFQGNNGENWEVAIRKANGDVREGTAHRFTSNNDTGDVTVIATLEDAAAGDKYTFEIKNETDDDDATVVSGTVAMLYLME